MTARNRRGKFFLAAIAGLGLMGTAAIAAPTMGHHGFHCDRNETPTVEEVRSHMDRAASRALRSVDATDAQRAEIDAILDDFAPLAVDLHAEGRQLRDQAHASLEGGTVDADALESLRQDGVGLFDRATSTALTAFIDIADVLTAEQRAELAEQHQR